MEDLSISGSSIVPGGQRPVSAMRRNHSHSPYLERPASSASNHTRLTMSSSGASANGSSQGSLATPKAANSKGASLLQERLRDRKVESARAASHSNGAADGRVVQSSPIKGSGREERMPHSGGVGQVGKGMGVKMMEEQVSTLHKQNFDLKLELYHRRKRQETLEARLEERERQLEEFAEMREVNDQLLAELERRDQALDEAVGVIVTLEDKIDRMMREREMVRTVDDNPYNPLSEFSSSPPPMHDETPRKHIVRMPSFLSERSEGTEALRSLYQPHNRSDGEAALAQLDEESFDGMNSPRLSVLSESSFLSVYGDKLDLNEASEEQPKRHRASSSVEKWVDDRPTAIVTPQRVSPDLIRRKQFLSINDVLESPLQRLEKLKHTLEKHTLPERSDSVNTHRKGRENLKNVFTDKKSFENQHSLPPTPDTFSTNTLRHFQGSDDTLAHKGKFLSATSSFTPGITQNNYQSTISVRPRSVGETVTSRRDGHGWDTETQTDVTETGSTTSTYSPSAAYEPLKPTIKRVRTPDLFNFNTSDKGTGDWGRDVLFNHHNNEEELDLPPLNNKRIDRARRASMIEAQHPKSDDTVIQYNNSNNANSRYSDRRSPAFPLDEHSPRPDPPDRRSSLIAMQKIRKGSSAASSPLPSSKENALQLQVAAHTPTSRKARLASRIFGRGSNSISTSDSSTTTQQQQVQEINNALVLAKKPEVPRSETIITLPRQRPPFSNTSTSTNRSNTTQCFDSFLSNPTVTCHVDSFSEEADRATPPPIRRSKTYANTPVASRTRGRPSSAGAGVSAGKVKRISGFGGDGAFDDGTNGFAEQNSVTYGEEKTKGHRRGSLSVDVGVARGLGALIGGGGAGAGGEEGEKSGNGDVGGEGKRKWLGLRRG